VRPISKKELRDGAFAATTCPGDDVILVKQQQGAKAPSYKFSFDKVYGGSATQGERLQRNLAPKLGSNGLCNPILVLWRVLDSMLRGNKEQKGRPITNSASIYFTKGPQGERLRRTPFTGEPPQLSSIAPKLVVNAEAYD
jgi:hypothetical protein